MPAFTPISTASDLSALGVPSATAQGFARTPAVPAGFDHLAYCDGACSGNGRKGASPGGWGVLLLGASGPTQVGFAGEGDTTNNRMELLAGISGLRATAPGKAVVLRTDSQYVVKGCTEWRTGWQRRGMTNSKGEAVLNPDLWRQLWAEVDARKVKFEWVRGHNGDPGNEIADALAVLGATGARRG